MTAEKTKIKASYIIAFDGTRHRYLRDGELVFQGQDIIYIGKSYEGEVAKTIDAKGKIISPGFISTHAHLSESPMDRSFVEDVGKPQFYFSGLYEMLPTRGAAMDREMLQLCLEYSLAEILRSGTTTVVELGPFGEDLLPLIPVLGNRVYFGQFYRSGRWYTPDGKQVLYEWHEHEGKQAMEGAVKFIEQHDGDFDGRLRFLLSPLQADTCTEELLLKSQQWAQKLDIPLSIHVSQSVVEFNEMLKRHGKTPIAWLRDIGFLQYLGTCDHCRWDELDQLSCRRP
jgi:cytosine/adenosine deaminase-related metal-dependent hydrolase